MPGQYKLCLDRQVLFRSFLRMTTDQPDRESPRTKAAREGRRFFTGKSCAGCGGRKRYTSNGQCVACALRQGKERHAKIQALLEEAREQESVE